MDRSPNESAKTTKHFVLPVTNTAVVCFVEKFSFLVKKGVYFANIMLISWWAKSPKLLSSCRLTLKIKRLFLYETHENEFRLFFTCDKNFR